MMSIQFKLAVLLFGVLLSGAASALAQQSPVITEKELLRIAPRPKSEPRANLPAAAKVAVEPESATTAEERRRNAEMAWSIRLRIAQERARDLERRADATELEINRLQNRLFSGEPRPSKTQVEWIANIGELTRELRRLRGEAQIARAQVEELLDEGVAAGFRAYATTTALQLQEGMSAGQYYRTRDGELKTELSDTERRAEVMQLRINDLSRRILLNSGSGDEFYNARLRDRKTDLEVELSALLTREEYTNRKLDELRRQARAVGIYLN
ncbi:MAG: hypothetical protein HY231_19230 [Acidobacteria bacterium]|nr:hypothetical protein [Acidobacteriota bacterium]